MGLAALVALIWGLCFVLIQASLPSPAPLLLAASRAIIGGGVLAAWIAGRRWWSIQHPSDRSQPRSTPLRSVLPSVPVLVALSATNAAIALGAMYLAASRAEATVASILAGAQPVILAAAGWAVFGERPSGRTTAGLGVAMAGLVLVAVMSSGAASPEGIALALFASVAPGVGTVLMRRIGPSVDLLVTTSAQFIVGGVMLLAVSAAVEPWGALTWSPAATLALLVLGVLGTGLAYVLWFQLLDRLPLAQLGTALFLVPVVGVVAGIATGYRPPIAVLAGIGAVLVGIGLITDAGEAAPRSGSELLERAQLGRSSRCWSDERPARNGRRRQP
jgi:drug/metabolite transporter (DMT)-like permease